MSTGNKNLIQLLGIGGRMETLQTNSFVAYQSAKKKSNRFGKVSIRVHADFEGFLQPAWTPYVWIFLYHGAIICELVEIVSMATDTANFSFKTYNKNVTLSIQCLPWDQCTGIAPFAFKSRKPGPACIRGVTQDETGKAREMREFIYSTVLISRTLWTLLVLGKSLCVLSRYKMDWEICLPSGKKNNMSSVKSNHVHRY